jgi:hypothetical protein
MRKGERECTRAQKNSEKGREGASVRGKEGASERGRERECERVGVRKRGTHVTRMTGWDAQHLSGWFVENPNVDTSLLKLYHAFVDVGHLPERVQETEYNEPMQARVRGFDGNITGLHESVQELRHVGPFCHGRSCVVDTKAQAIYLCRSTIGTPLPSLLVGIKRRYAWLWSIYYV